MGLRLAGKLVELVKYDGYSYGKGLGYGYNYDVRSRDMLTTEWLKVELYE